LRARRVAQGVERLPGKNTALRSNPSTTSQKWKEFKNDPEEFTGKFNHALQNKFSQFLIISSRGQKHNQYFLIYSLMTALP
jgi:hypothetical protein